MSNRHHFVDIDKSILSYQEQLYLPVYPPSYLEKSNEIINYTVWVHIINTSQVEPIYLLCIDCYDSNGDKCEKLIEKSIKINPLESSKFIVNTDLSGQGSGANVIIDWGVKNLDSRPDIYIEMVVKSSDKEASFIENAQVVTDQDEILDRRPL